VPFRLSGSRGIHILIIYLNVGPRDSIPVYSKNRGLFFCRTKTEKYPYDLRAKPLRRRCGACAARAPQSVNVGTAVAMINSKKAPYTRGIEAKGAAQVQYPTSLPIRVLVH